MVSEKVKISLLILIFFGYFLIKTNFTSADLYAQRIVKKNSLTATTLSFSTRHTANNRYLNFFFNTNEIQPEGFDLAAVRIKKDGKLSFKYRLKYIKKGGDEDLCQNLNLIVLQNWQQKYQGKLANFSLDSTLPSSGKEEWIFYLILDDNDSNLKNKVCQFDFYFKTYRDDPESKKGFYAERTLPNYVSSGSW